MKVRGVEISVTLSFNSEVGISLVEDFLFLRDRMTVEFSHVTKGTAMDPG